MQALRNANFQENKVGYRIRLWFTFIYSKLATCEDYRAFKEIKPALLFVPDGHDPIVSVLFYQYFNLLILSFLLALYDRSKPAKSVFDYAW